MDAFLKKGKGKKAEAAAKPDTSKQPTSDTFNLTIKTATPGKKSKVVGGGGLVQKLKNASVPVSAKIDIDEVDMDVDEDKHASKRKYQPWVEK